MAYQSTSRSRKKARAQERKNPVLTPKARALAEVQMEANRRRLGVGADLGRGSR
jgi:hypothetical protein